MSSEFATQLLDQLGDHGGWVCVHALKDAGITPSDKAAEESLAEAIAELLRDRYGVGKR